MESNSPVVSESVAFSFYKSLGKSDFVVVKTEAKDNGIVKIIATCLLCREKGQEKLVAGDNKSRGNFTKHLKIFHPDDHERFLKQKQDIKRPRLEEKGPLDNFQIGFTSGKKKLLDKLTMRYIVNGMRPLSTVEDIDFRNLLRGALQDQNVSFMDRKSLGKKIMEDFNFTKASITNKLSSLTICCLTADLWSSRSRSYLGVTAHWISESLKRESSILACRRFKGTHSYDKIAIELNRVMNEFAIPRSKIVAIVTDNGSNFVKAFKEFGIEYVEDTVLQVGRDSDSDSGDNDSDRGSDSDEVEESVNSVPISEVFDSHEGNTYDLPPHMRCVAHTLNLVVTADVVDKGMFHKVIGKCVKLFNLSSSPKSADIIRSVCGKDLKRPVPTRWNSLYDSIKHLLDQEKHLNKICSGLNLPAFLGKEIDFLKEYVKISEPLATVLDTIQDVYMGELLPKLKGLMSKLNKLKCELTYTTSFVDAMISGIGRRFAHILELNFQDPSDFVFASLSHPYFKARWIPVDQQAQLKNAFVARCREMVTISHGKTEDVIFSPDDDLYEFFESQISNSDQTTKVELECLQYFEDKCTDLDILKKYPHVEKAFKRYNTCLPSSGSAERLFSSAGLILAPRRCRLSDKMFNILVFLKCNRDYQI